MLRSCKTIVFFFAMLLPIVLEGAPVYWIFPHPLKPLTSNLSVTAVGEWIGMALPEVWLLGALFALIYRAGTVVITPASRTNQVLSRTWQAFVRLLHWTIAMILMQELVLFLDRSVAS